MGDSGEGGGENASRAVSGGDAVAATSDGHASPATAAAATVAASPGGFPGKNDKGALPHGAPYLRPDSMLSQDGHV